MIRVAEKGLELHSDLGAYGRLRWENSEDFANRDRQREYKGRLWEDVSLIARKICECGQVLKQTFTLTCFNNLTCTGKIMKHLKLLMNTHGRL